MLTMTDVGLRTMPTKITDCVMSVHGVMTKIKVFTQNGNCIKIMHKDNILWENKILDTSTLTHFPFNSRTNE